MPSNCTLSCMMVFRCPHSKLQMHDVCITALSYAWQVAQCRYALATFFFSVQGKLRQQHVDTALASLKERHCWQELRRCQSVVSKTCRIYGTREQNMTKKLVSLCEITNFRLSTFVFRSLATSAYPRKGYGDSYLPPFASSDVFLLCVCVHKNGPVSQESPYHNAISAYILSTHQILTFKQDNAKIQHFLSALERGWGLHPTCGVLPLDPTGEFHPHAPGLAVRLQISESALANRLHCKNPGFACV